RWWQAGGRSNMHERLKDRGARATIRREMEAPNPTWENRYQSAGTWQNIQIASINGRSGGASPTKKYEGMRIAEAANQAGKDPFDFVFDLLAESGEVSCVYFIIDDA